MSTFLFILMFIVFQWAINSLLLRNQALDKKMIVIIHLLAVIIGLTSSKTIDVMSFLRQYLDMLSLLCITFTVFDYLRITDNIKETNGVKD